MAHLSRSSSSRRLERGKIANRLDRSVKTWEMGYEVLDWLRLAIEVTLGLIAVKGDQSVSMGLSLHALGDGLEPKSLAHHDDRSNDTVIAFVMFKILHEGPVDLDLMDLEALQIAKR